MILPGYFAVLGALINLIGVILYIRYMFLGKVKPNKVTWGLWALSSGISFASSFAAGGGIQTLLAFSAGFGPLLVFVFSYLVKQSFWEISAIDYIIGGVALMAIILWLITDNPRLALILAIIADVLAFLPTFIKGWNEPDTESVLVFSAGIIGPALVLLTVDSWVLEKFVFSVYLILANGLFVVTLHMRRKLITSKL